MWWGWGKVYGLGAVYFTMSLSSTDTQAHATPVTYARRAINWWHRGLVELVNGVDAL